AGTRLEMQLARRGAAVLEAQRAAPRAARAGDELDRMLWVAERLGRAPGVVPHALRVREAAPSLAVLLDEREGRERLELRDAVDPEEAERRPRGARARRLGLAESHAHAPGAVAVPPPGRGLDVEGLAGDVERSREARGLREALGRGRELRAVAD